MTSIAGCRRFAPRAGLALVPRVMRLAVVVGYGLSSFGCSDGETPTAPVSDVVPIAGCERFVYGPCDVEEVACRDNLFGLVRCVRGTSGGSMVPVETITAAQYRDRLTAANTDLDPAEVQNYETALVLLGLMSPGDLTVSHQIDVIVSAVAAYYSSDEEKITLILPDATATGDQPTPVMQTLVLAHEMLHALQDQQYDLTALEPAEDTSYDRHLARNSVVEGEAKLYETMLYAAFYGIRQEEAAYVEHFTRGVAYTLSHAPAESPYLLAPRVLPYFYGARYCYLTLQKRGRAGIDALFANPPGSLSPFLLSEHDLVEPALSPVQEAAPAALEGTTLAAVDTLGAWIALKAEEAAGSTVNSAQSIGSWRGDRLWVYTDNQTQEVAIVWRVRRDSPGAADSFAAHLMFGGRYAGGGQRQTFVSGSDVFVVGVSGQLTLDPWVEAAKASAAAGSSAPSSPDGSNTGASSPSAARRLVLPEPRVSPAVGQAP